MLLEPGQLRLRKLIGLQHVDAGLGEQPLEQNPALLLLVGQLGHEAVDAVELLCRGQTVLARRIDAGDHLAAQARHAHHVEFIEVGGRDGQEPQALQQRMPLVLRLLEHPAVEMEPGEFAVEEPARTVSGNAGVDLGRLHLI